MYVGLLSGKCRFSGICRGRVEEGEALPEYVDFVDRFTGGKYCFPPGFALPEGTIEWPDKKLLSEAV